MDHKGVSVNATSRPIGSASSRRFSIDHAIRVRDPGTKPRESDVDPSVKSSTTLIGRESGVSGVSRKKAVLLP